MRRGVPRVTCPYCGAEYEVPGGVSHAVCPYCGTVVELATGREVPTGYYPWRLEEQEAFAYALERLETLPGAPRGLGEEAGYAKGTLHMVSLYVYRLAAWVEGCEEAREEVEEALLASDAPSGFPSDYSFPVVGRAPYKPGLRKGIVFHVIREDVEELRKRVVAKKLFVLLGRVYNEGFTFCGVLDRGRLRSETRLIGVAHYPVWELVYTYRGRGYRVLVDAVEPRVVYAEYPARRRRAARLLLGYTLGAGAVVLASLLAGTPFLRASLFGATLIGAYAVYATLPRSKLVYRGEKPWTPKEAYGVFTRRA